jgi:PLP dependent protein
MLDAKPSIVDAIREVQRNIEAARERSVWAAPKVLLLAVTKTQPLEIMSTAEKAGLTDFGENRVQELMDKLQFFPKINWHLIGHLQTNKVKYVVGKTVLIHSLDSIDLAAEIEKRSAAQDLITHALVQLNIAEEETKRGLQAEELADFLAAMRDYPHLQIQGLMTIGPHVDEQEEIRPVFAELRRLFLREKGKGWPHLDLRYLSMGMSYDYQVAVEEGANIVRVGSGIFGARG